MTNDIQKLLEYAATLDRQPIETAPMLHQIDILGKDLDVGTYTMHWRDDKNIWCYAWNQEPCFPTHWMPLPDGNAGAVIRELVEALRDIKVYDLGCDASCHSGLGCDTPMLSNTAKQALGKAAALVGGGND